MRKKNYIIVDPVEDPLLLQLLNDVSLDGQAIFEYSANPDKWIKVSGKFGRRAKSLKRKENPLVYPPATSRPNKISFIILPKNVECNKQMHGDKFKFVFKHKIF